MHFNQYENKFMYWETTIVLYCIFGYYSSCSRGAGKAIQYFGSQNNLAWNPGSGLQPRKVIILKICEPLFPNLE